MTGPIWDPSQWEAPRRDYYSCYGLLTDRRLAGLSSERLNKQLTEKDTDTYTQPMDWRQGPLWLNLGMAVRH